MIDMKDALGSIFLCDSADRTYSILSIKHSLIINFTDAILGPKPRVLTTPASECLITDT